MLPPPVEMFRMCANAAHDAARASSAFVAYHDITRSQLSRRSLTFGVKVTIDETTGNVTVRSDEGNRSYVARVAQPVAANFNALSDFGFKFYVDDDAKLRYAYAYLVRPLTYTTPAPADRRSDVVVYALKGYTVQYAEDTTSEAAAEYHLTLRPVDDEHRRVIHFTDVYVDAASHLPTRVVFEGDDDTHMVFEYSNSPSRLVLKRFDYRQRIYGPAHVTRSTVKIETLFDSVTYTDHDPYDDATIPAPASGRQ